jgi:hypothetical protein
MASKGKGRETFRINVLVVDHIKNALMDKNVLRGVY